MPVALLTTTAHAVDLNHIKAGMPCMAYGNSVIVMSQMNQV